MKQQLRESEPTKEALLLYGKEDSYGIYQLARGDATRDLRFEPYDRLQATGHTVDRANYELIYTAPLTADITLNSIWEKFISTTRKILRDTAFPFPILWCFIRTAKIPPTM